MPKFLKKMKFAAYSLALLTLLQSCSQNNVKQDKNLKKYFDENKVEGCFALMDNGTGKFTVHNLGRYRDSSYLPASTFKIVNSLIGLQTGKISSDSMVIKWDGVKRRVEEWNRDLTMYDAFRVSAVNYYQEVARRIGKDTMQLWLDSLRYGTKKITSTIDSFWLDNSLKISPDEELGLVKRLYFDHWLAVIWPGTGGKAKQTSLLSIFAPALTECVMKTPRRRLARLSCSAGVATGQVSLPHMASARSAACNHCRT